MNDSSKLFVCSVVLLICGLMKGAAPTALEQPFDTASFLMLCIIAVIVALLGLIKYRKGK